MYLVDATIEGWYVSSIQVSSGNPVIVLVGDEQVNWWGYYSDCTTSRVAGDAAREGKLIAEVWGEPGLSSIWIIRRVIW